MALDAKLSRIEFDGPCGSVRATAWGLLERNNKTYELSDIDAFELRITDNDGYFYSTFVCFSDGQALVDRKSKLGG
jgi:hypothetical protein